MKPQYHLLAAAWAAGLTVLAAGADQASNLHAVAPPGESASAPHVTPSMPTKGADSGFPGVREPGPTRLPTRLSPITSPLPAEPARAAGPSLHNPPVERPSIFISPSAFPGPQQVAKNPSGTFDTSPSPVRRMHHGPATRPSDGSTGRGSAVVSIPWYGTLWGYPYGGGWSGVEPFTRNTPLDPNWRNQQLLPAAPQQPDPTAAVAPQNDPEQARLVMADVRARVQQQFENSHDYRSAQEELRQAQEHYDHATQRAALTLKSSPEYQRLIALQQEAQRQVSTLQFQQRLAGATTQPAPEISPQLTQAAAAKLEAKAALAKMESEAADRDDQAIAAKARLVMAIARVNELRQQVELAIQTDPAYQKAKQTLEATRRSSARAW